MPDEIKSTILIGGSGEFIQECRELAKTHELEVVGEALTVEDVYNKIDVVQPQGVLTSAEDNWVRGVKTLAPLRRNILFFVAGAVKKQDWDDLTDVKAIVVPGDLQKAMPAISGALLQISPTRYRFTNAQTIDVRQSLNAIHQENAVELLKTVLIVFYSPKGGAGKTTMSSNIAAATGIWAKTIKSKNLRVAFIDFNCDYGNAKYSFGFSPFDTKKPRTVVGFRDLDLAASWQVVRDSMNYHEKSNVYFLAAPETAAERQDFTEELARKVMDIVKKHFHFVFVDLGVALDRRDAAIVSMDMSTDIVLVLDIDMDTTALVYEHKQEIERIIGDYNRVRLAVNKVRPKIPFSVKDIVKLLNLPLLCQVPYSPLVEKVKGNGIPAVCASQNDPFSKEIFAAARLLLGAQMVGFGSQPVSIGTRIRNLFVCRKRRS